MALDTITMLIALGIVSCGFSTAILLVWRFLLPQKPLLHWSGALGFYGAGIFLVVLRAYLPDWLSILVANLLIISGYALIWVGMCHYRGRKPDYRTLLLSLLLFVPVFAWFTWITPNISIRIIVIRLFMIIYLAAAAATLLQNSGRALTLMEKATALCLLTDAVFRLLDIVVQLTDLSYVEPLYRNTIVLFTATTALFSITAWSLAAILMTLEKVVNEKQKTEDMFNQFMLYTPVYTYIKQIDAGKSIVCHASANFERMLGVSAGAIIGKTMDELFPAEFAAQMNADDLQVAASGEVFEQEEVFNDRRYTTIKFPLIQQGGQRFIAGFTIDITERKRAEEEQGKLQEQLAQARKIEAVGRLAGGVAHDFNNMLSVILGHTELALMQMDPGQPLFERLQEIRKAATHSADLTRQLLAFARKQIVVPKVLDLNATLETMLKMLRRLIGENIELVWLPGENLSPLKMDPSQIDQLLANLCVNARDAISGVGRVTIETENATLDAGYCAGHDTFLLPGEYVLLTVSDTGCGMDKEAQAKIFEPFFTTKELGKGTGLGLATVYGIVKQNNGFITVASEPGAGTTFRIYLSPYVGKTGQLQTEGHAGELSRGHETVLLVEDEPALLDMGKIMLESLGYRVMAASTPDEAIRLVENHTEAIHLVLTDVIMPGMNGRELAKRLQALSPNIKCLFMSGYTANVIAEHGVREEGLHFIQKPFSMEELADKLRRGLEQ